MQQQVRTKKAAQVSSGGYNANSPAKIKASLFPSVSVYQPGMDSANGHARTQTRACLHKTHICKQTHTLAHTNAQAHNGMKTIKAIRIISCIKFVFMWKTKK